MSLVLAATARAGDKDAGRALASTAVASWCGCGDFNDGRVGGKRPDTRDDPTFGEGSDDDDDDDDAWNALLARQQRLGRGWGRGKRGLDRADDDDDEIDEPLPRLASRAFDVMVAAHAAYESSKLDSLRRPALAPLNALCTALATTLRRSRNADVAAIAGGYLEHHGRDAGAVVGTATYVSVADGTRAGRDRRAGARPGTGHGADTWAGLVPPAVAAEMAERDAGRDAFADPSEGVTGNGPRVSGCVSWAANVVAFVARAAESSVAAAAGDDETADSQLAGRRARDDARGVRRRRARARAERVGFDPSRRASAV